MKPTGSMDMDICQVPWLVSKVRDSDIYAQNLYAAMCNQDWQYQDVWTVLVNKTWRCSWRGAGGIIADIRGEGDYMNWYCSGMMRSHPDDDLVHNGKEEWHVAEGTITDEIRHDLARIGWHPVDQ